MRTVRLVQVDDCTLYPGQPVTQLDPRLYPYFTDTAVAQCNQDRPLFNVTLARTPHAGGASDFALLVSMCHNLGDGHTFYTICAGLGAGAVRTHAPPKRRRASSSLSAAGTDRNCESIVAVVREPRRLRLLRDGGGGRCR